MKLTAEQIEKRIKWASKDVASDLTRLGESGEAIHPDEVQAVAARRMYQLLVDVAVFVPGEIEPVTVTPESDNKQ